MEENAVLILEKSIFMFLFVKLAAIFYSRITLLVTDMVE